MRTSVAQQLPLVPQMTGHDHMDELREMNKIIDAHPRTAELVLADLLAGGIDPNKGATGLSGGQVLRALVIKQINNYSYEQLAFHLADSMSYRAFCRFGFSETPSSSTLQENIKKVREETLQAINRIVIGYAKDTGVENGRKVRTDCTVIDSNIHDPKDSLLLWDCVRVLTRELKRAEGDVDFVSPDHTRRAKRRSIGIQNAKNKEQRKEKYLDLIKVTEKTLGYAKRTVLALEEKYSKEQLEARENSFYAKLTHYIGLTEQVLDQTRRRVLNEESVPVAEKIVSIFEPHTDIIVKDRRDTFYGHKVCLTAGASGLVLDCVIQAGNPADSNLAVEMIERQIELYGRPPRQAVFDGGFSSKDNLETIKSLEVQDVAFSKAPGIPLLDMVKSSWVYRQLKRFRAGVESVISFLKRSFGWSRCTWRSLESFKAYTQASVVACNLLVLARHALSN